MNKENNEIEDFFRTENGQGSNIPEGFNDNGEIK